MEKDKNNRKEMEIKETIQVEEKEEYKNLKERLYDKIPISLKTLDIIITVLVTIFILMMVYFVFNKYR
ncbi:MAG: hypothetical protein GX306_11605 [Clostridiales bacterium]|jgi:hypothetical protein|nr:hypothetical protein [Clostridiales bacterium]